MVFLVLVLTAAVPAVCFGDAGIESFWNTAYDTDYYVEVSASDGGANLRSGAGVEYGTIISGMMPNGTVLHITRVATADNGKKWGETEYQGSTGWVALSQTKTTSAPSSGSQSAADTGDTLEDTGPAATLASAATAADYDIQVAAPDGGVYFRCGPGQSYAKIISNMIPNGTKLHVSGEGKASNGKAWALTEYNGQLGWVFLGHTEKLAAGSAQPQQKEQQAADENAEKKAENAEQPAGQSDTAQDSGADTAKAADDDSLVISKNTLLKAALAVLGLLVVILLLTIVMLTRKKNRPAAGVYGRDMRKDRRNSRDGYYDDPASGDREYRDPWDR